MPDCLRGRELNVPRKGKDIFLNYLVFVTWSPKFVNYTSRKMCFFRFWTFSLKNIFLWKKPRLYSILAWPFFHFLNFTKKVFTSVLKVDVIWHLQKIPYLNKKSNESIILQPCPKWLITFKISYEIKLPSLSRRKIPTLEKIKIDCVRVSNPQLVRGGNLIS